MNAYELLILNRNILQVMDGVSLDVGDVKYIPVYQEYMRLYGKGIKRPISCNIYLMSIILQKGQFIESLINFQVQLISKVSL